MSLRSGEEIFALAMDQHQRCTLQKRFLGETSSCPANYILQLRNLTADLQLHIPSLSPEVRLTIDNMEQIVDQEFHSLSGQNSQKVYAQFQRRTKALRDLLALLFSLSDNGPKRETAFEPLCRLQRFVFDTKFNIESILFQMLDACPNETANILRSVMTLMEKSHKVKLPHMSSSNFETIGVKRWLDDEVMNYFVTKWCSESPTTLGLSTFFPCRFIFQENLCIHAKTGVLTSEDEKRVQKWCRAAEKAQGLVQWERVFIPINENNIHWYSACINFGSKRIDIYDSLGETGFQNRQKPIQLRKNTKTMLVLMWLAEVLGRMRGEEIGLQNNPTCAWRCDPHAEVPYQHNSYDCGVHTLWHLRHVLEFGLVKSSCKSPHLRFSRDMIGQRLRLAQEMLDDSSI